MKDRAPHPPAPATPTLAALADAFAALTLAVDQALAPLNSDVDGKLFRMFSATPETGLTSEAVLAEVALQAPGRAALALARLAFRGLVEHRDRSWRLTAAGRAECDRLAQHAAREERRAVDNQARARIDIQRQDSRTAADLYPRGVVAFAARCGVSPDLVNSGFVFIGPERDRPSCLYCGAQATTLEEVRHADPCTVADALSQPHAAATR
jgi:hypothetical protein